MRIYLTGPITGQTSDEICDWREQFQNSFGAVTEVVDPARMPIDSVRAFEKLENSGEAMKRAAHGKLVVSRNRHLINQADLVFANFLNSKSASIGSIGELFWADSFGKPIVVVREDVGNVHNHAMLNALATVVSTSIADGYHAVCDILGLDAAAVGLPRLAK